MTALLKRGWTLAETLVDRANPLLVRHVRQELRNRGFIGVFVLLLLVAVLASLLMAGTADHRGEGVNGRLLFGLLGVALSFALWVAQPIGAYRAMTRERDDDTWDLIDLTGMRPGLILRGILQATLVQGTLYTAAIAPFMLMAYLLRGLDILTAVLITLGIVLVGVSLSAFAIFWGCLGPNKASRSTLFVLLILGLMVLWFSSWFWIIGLASGELSSLMTIDPTQAWTLLGLWFNGWAASLLLLLVLAGSLLTFRAGNRSTAPRLVWWGIAFNGLIWIFALSAAFGGSGWWFGKACLISGVLLTAWTLPLGLFAATEDRSLTPRQARWLREGGPVARFGGWFLGPGESRGNVCFLLMALLAVTLATIGGVLEDEVEVPRAAGVLLAYLAAYLGLAQVLAAGPLRGVIAAPMAKRVACFGLMVTLIMVQLMVNLVVDGGVVPLNVLSPIWGTIFAAGEIRGLSETSRLLHVAGMVVLLGTGLVVLVVSVVTGLTRPTTVRVRAQAGDHNPRGG